MPVTADSVSFGYNSRALILDGISFEFQDGKFYAVLGPNGVGKSTFIRCINRILKPKEGSILIDGKDVSDIPLKELAKTVGYVPYSAGDSFPLTVVDTVLMGRHPRSRFGSLVKDLEKAKKNYEEVLGIGPWGEPGVISGKNMELYVNGERYYDDFFKVSMLHRYGFEIEMI